MMEAVVLKMSVQMQTLQDIKTVVSMVEDSARLDSIGFALKDIANVCLEAQRTIDEMELVE